MDAGGDAAGERALRGAQVCQFGFGRPLEQPAHRHRLASGVLAIPDIQPSLHDLISTGEIADLSAHRVERPHVAVGHEDRDPAWVNGQTVRKIDGGPDRGQLRPGPLGGGKLLLLDLVGHQVRRPRRDIEKALSSEGSGRNRRRPRLRGDDREDLICAGIHRRLDGDELSHATIGEALTVESHRIEHHWNRRRSEDALSKGDRGRAGDGLPGRVQQVPGVVNPSQTAAVEANGRQSHANHGVGDRRHIQAPTGWRRLEPSTYRIHAEK